MGLHHQPCTSESRKRGELLRLEDIVKPVLSILKLESWKKAKKDSLKWGQLAGRQRKILMLRCMKQEGSLPGSVIHDLKMNKSGSVKQHKPLKAGSLGIASFTKERETV